MKSLKHMGFLGGFLLMALWSLDLPAALGSSASKVGDRGQYGFEIEIQPLENGDAYHAVATFTEMSMNRLISRPQLILKPGAAAHFEVGGRSVEGQGQETISMNIEVDPAKKTADVQAWISKSTFTVWKTRVQVRL